MTRALPALTSGPSGREIDTIARILLDTTNETAAVNVLGRYWSGAYDPRAIRQALKLADHDRSQHRGTVHSPRLRGTGDAARAVQRAELYYRAAYIANATRRINSKLEADLTLREATAAERTYYMQHELARRNRQNAAQAVDAAAGVYGALLGWHTHRDDRTTPECRAADGNNFRVGEPPRIGYPGSVHMYCRCSPGPPFARGRSVDQVTFGITH